MMLSSKKQIQAHGKFKVQNKHGLHVIPSIAIVKCACSFKSQIFLIYQRQSVNAKSLLSILTLTASKGAQIRVEAKGEDAEEAVQSIVNLANSSII
jgi:phosphocarrier protein HPr